MNDISRLKEEADIEQVINHLGLPVYRKGSAKFILCPLPGHDDKHPTNCYFKSGWNSCYCSVCHKSIQAIDLIMYTTGLDYGHAADELWQLEGCPDWYYDREYKQGRKQFSISQSECKLIGIQFQSRVEIPIRFTAHKEIRNDNLPANIFYGKSSQGYLLQKRSDNLTWKDFFTEQQMKKLVKQKCIDKLHELDQLDQSMASVFGNLDTCYPEERKKIEEIISRVDGRQN